MRRLNLICISLGLLLAVVSCSMVEDDDLQPPSALFESEDDLSPDLTNREPRSANGDIRQLRGFGGRRGGGGSKRGHKKHGKKTHGRGRGRG